MNSTVKGYLFAFGASMTLAASFVFSKAALNKTDMVVFGLTWFGTGAVLNAVWLLIRKRKYNGISNRKSTRGLALSLATLEGLATVFFYLAIRKMENPAIVSFIGNLGPVLVTILGITLLGERYNIRQMAGIVLALAGIFTISFHTGGNMDLLFQPGSQWVIIASVLFALATVIARRKKEILEPELMSTLRSVMLFLVFAVVFLVQGRTILPEKGVWTDILIGSFLETFLTIVFAYQALRYIEAAKTSLVISLKAVWVLAGALVFLDVFPSNLELTGGILSLAGIVMISLKKNQRSSRTYS